MALCFVPIRSCHCLTITLVLSTLLACCIMIRRHNACSHLSVDDFNRSHSCGSRPWYSSVAAAIRTSYTNTPISIFTTCHCAYARFARSFHAATLLAEEGLPRRALLYFIVRFYKHALRAKKISGSHAVRYNVSGTQCSVSQRRLSRYLNDSASSRASNLLQILLMSTYHE